MTTAADVIAALNQRRLLKQDRIETPGQMPAGWQQWFDAMPRADAQAARAWIHDWVTPLAQRLTYPQAKKVRLALPFFHLRRLAHPDDPRDERGLRVGVGILDILLHVLLAGMLLWLMYLRFVALAQQQAADPGTVVQVEFIGRGNAQAGGGAPADAALALPVPSPARPAHTSPAAAAAMQAASPVPLQPSSVAATDSEQMPIAVDASRKAPPLPPVEAAQVLQVSEVSQPQPGNFKLPPPREASVVLPQVTLHEAQPQQQVVRIEQFEAKPVRTLQATRPQVALREIQPRQQVEQIQRFEGKPLRTLQQPVQPQVVLRAPDVQEQVRALDVFTPDRKLLTDVRATPVAPQPPSLQKPQLAGQVQALPLRQVPAQPSEATPVTAAAVAAGKPAQAKAGQGVATAGSDAGPKPAPAAGGWPSAAKSDDWGAARRNAPGTGSRSGETGKDAGSGEGKQALFDADGSVRLPDAWTQDDGLDLDRAGRWLERPGLEYRGTRFDKYWIPSGSLLEEWVRRGIKQVSIPIPGTGLKLQCVISLLQFGGGCMPVNPDANEQPSSGRKAPEIPFKPALQEDNGSVRPAPAPPAPPVQNGG